MAFRKALIQRLLDSTKISPQAQTPAHPPASFPLFRKTVIPPNTSKTSNHREIVTAPDSCGNGFIRRFLQSRKIDQFRPELLSLPTGDELMEKLRGVNINKDRIRLDGISPPVPTLNSMERISVEDARKVLRASKLEALKTKLRQTSKSCISYSEFVQICVEGCLNSDEGLEFAKALDESGAVMVLGNVVFLRPDQVAKAIEAVIPLSIAHPNDPRRKELEEMEMRKKGIDRKAEALARRELWCGLGILMMQTAAFMRLTFWELSWDVMEPICFYVTSVYFMAGYAFFLRTSRDPSFEGFFESRFSAKQKRLMRINKFDLKRFNQLRAACYPDSSSSCSEEYTSPFDKSERSIADLLIHSK